MGARDLTIVLLVVVVAIVLLPMVGMSVWGMGMMGPWPMADGMMGWRPGWGGGIDHSCIGALGRWRGPGRSRNYQQQGPQGSDSV